MTDAIHDAARKLFERVGWLYQAGDPKCTEEAVRALHASALRQRAEGAKEAAAISDSLRCSPSTVQLPARIEESDNLYDADAFDLGIHEACSYLKDNQLALATRLEAQAKEIEGQ